MVTYKHTNIKYLGIFLLSDLQHSLDLRRDVGLLVQLDALLVRPARALHGDLLQVGQHHAVSLGHCLELIKQQLQQLQQQPVEGGRESRKGGREGEEVGEVRGERSRELMKNY